MHRATFIAHYVGGFLPETVKHLIRSIRRDLSLSMSGVIVAVSLLDMNHGLRN